MNQTTFGVLHLFCGIGGAALGMQEAEAEWRGIHGTFYTLAGIDCDPEACRDFETLTGAPAVQMDLFSREDYRAFHGHEPPEGWREATPADLRAATGGIAPDVIFTSPPCKGFSGLLPSKSAKSAKYQALNRLTVRGLQLALEAFKDDLPGLIMLENVPRITSRGAGLLRQIKAFLGVYGYLFHEGYHDCGEIGGLGQRRKRYLLIARNPAKVTSFVYKPPKLPLKTIGDIIGPLPMPDDPAGGPMHRLPRLQWKTWVRLALIPAGGDWRDLEKIAPEQYRLEYMPRGSGSYGVMRWDKPAGTVAGNTKVNGSTAANIADPRTGFKPGTHHAIYRVRRWDEPAGTVTGAHRPNNGAICVADPRIPKDTEPGVWVIIAEDGTWHRPLTTWELLALQGFPVYMPGGEPVVLAGKSDARWRERIGNAVPPPAARAIGEQMLMALLPSIEKTWAMGATSIWVQQKEGVFGE